MLSDMYFNGNCARDILKKGSLYFIIFFLQKMSKKHMDSFKETYATAREISQQRK
jgi:hypothetical protein